MIEVHVVVRTLLVDCNALYCRGYTEPANAFAIKRIPMKQRVWHSASIKVLAIVCPCAVISAECNLLCASEFVVVPSVTHSISKPSLISDQTTQLLELSQVVDWLATGEELFEVVVAAADFTEFF